MDAGNTQKNTADLLREIHETYRGNIQPIPSWMDTKEWINSLISILFPIDDEALFSEAKLQLLQSGLHSLLQPIKNSIDPVDRIVEAFFDKLPDIFRKLQKDAQAILASDPAAHSLEEVIAAYPGFYAITAYRIAHELYSSKIPILPRLISEYAHSVTGIDINPGAVIGSDFIIDHGTGIVIGETCILGNNVKIYQGVTLGALSVSKTEANKKRHPTIEDNVVIYAGTTILGGQTVIGHDSVIGGNVWLTESVPAYSLVYHKSEVRVRSNDDFLEGINFTI